MMIEAFSRGADMTRRISNEAAEFPAREASEIRANALQEALIAGEQSGEATSFDGEAFLARMNAKHGGGAK